jgi:hypothetical protein
MRSITAGRLLVVSAVLVSGCATTGAKHGVVFQDKYIVGGGFQVEYRAPEPGRAILVDVSSGRALMTESLGTGGLFESSMDPGDPGIAEFMSTLGIDLAEANLVLYFIPDSTQRE